MANYTEGDIAGNIRKFLTQHDPSTEGENFIQLLTTVIQKEEAHKDQFVFYHATEPAVRILIDFYSETRNKLQARQRWVTVLRGWDTFFKGIEDVNQFIEKAKGENGDNVNDHGEIDGQPFSTYGISVNFSLFGNHTNGSEKTLRYFLGNSVAPPDFDKIVLNFLDKIGVPENQRELKKEQLKSLLNKYFVYNGKANNTLLQIFVNPRVVDKISYMSFSTGKLLRTGVGKGVVNTANLELSKLLSLLKGTTPEEMVDTVDKLSNSFDSGPHGCGRDLTRLQARLFLKPEYMLDPDVVNILSYTLYEFDQEAYQQEMSQIVDQMLVSILESKSAFQPDTFYDGDKTALQKMYEVAYQESTGSKLLYKIDDLLETQLKIYIDNKNLEKFKELCNSNLDILFELVINPSFSGTEFTSSVIHGRAKTKINLLSYIKYKEASPGEDYAEFKRYIIEKLNSIPSEKYSELIQKLQQNVLEYAEYIQILLPKIPQLITGDLLENLPLDIINDTSVSETIKSAMNLNGRIATPVLFKKIMDSCKGNHPIK